MKINVGYKVLMALAIVLLILSSIVPAFQTEELIIEEDPIFDLKVEILQKIGHLPSLSVGVIKDNKLVWYKGYGEYDGEHTPTKDTMYLIGSTTKSFTATAVMQLCEQGYFDLDDDVNNFLDFELKNPYYPEYNITFRMILGHQSSLGFMGKAFDDIWEIETDFDSISLESVLKDRLLGDEKEKYWDESKPGEKYVYSNIGYALLGYLVECITHQNFSQYCKENIFEPLEMYNTSFNVKELNESNIAVPYIWYDLGFKKYQAWINLPHYTDSMYPAGYLRTSVEDLSHYLIAHMNNGLYNGNRILNQSTVEEMHKVQYPNNKRSLLGLDFGIGFHIKERFGETIRIGHGGDVIGCHSNMWIRVKDNVGIIYFTNIQLNKDFRGFFVRQMLTPLIFNKADNL